MRSRRAALLVLTASMGSVGAWCLVLPASFYTQFPLGRAWVAIDGPYNEHLVRDVGGLYLAVAVVTATAAWSLRPATVRLAAVASLTTGVPHLLYHALHLEGYGPVDAVANIVTLSVSVALPAWLAWAPAPRASARTQDTRPPMGARR